MRRNVRSATTSMTMSAFASRARNEARFTTVASEHSSRLIITEELARKRHRFLLHSTVRRFEMLYTLAVILLIAWLLGVVGTYTIGAFVHVLLVLALVLFIMGLVTGRRPVI